MAKRKRLSPANPAMFGAPETKSMMSRAPIADVAAEAATTAALSDVTRELSEARTSGRMVLSLPVASIALDHIVRDRVIAEEPEMEALMTSIAARGQQTPIEVLETEQGQYGLISGWRRCQAIARLAERGMHDGTVLALMRAPKEASETYQAMVEENEIRVGLSYFERARIVAKAVEQGVFASDTEALRALFASASRAKRSKIRSFLPLVAAFDGKLRFPHLIGERLGLKLSAALDTDPGVLTRARQALKSALAQTAEAEQEALTRALIPSLNTDKSTSERMSRTVRPGVKAEWDTNGSWLKLSGKGLDADVRDQILDLLRKGRS